MAPSTLTSHNILFSGSTFRLSKPHMKKIIKDNDAKVLSSWSRKVTLVIVPEEGFVKPTKAVQSAFDCNIPVVTEAWLESDDDDHSKYEMKKPASEPQVGASSSSGAARKRPTTTTSTPQKAARSMKPKKVDDYYPSSSASVHEDYSCILNQTNARNNNNKFYVLQLIKDGSRYVVFTRWGRVGEKGQSKPIPCSNLNAAIKEFEKKFKAKSANKWSDRDDFVPKKGKYTLIEMDEEDDDVDEQRDALSKLKEKSPRANRQVQDSVLHPKLQQFIGLIFNDRMMEEQMEKFDLNTKEMPLGKLSQNQINKGFDVLNELEDAIEAGEDTTDLTDDFYTVIPHSFGRKRPPIIRTAEQLKQKVDMLNVLSDIEVVQGLNREREQQELEESQQQQEEGAEAPKEEHPLDKKYKQLEAELQHVDPKSEEFAMINNYFKNTMERKGKILEVFKVERNTEAERYSVHEELENRRLLWHGTNIAVAVPCIKGGLRIFPNGCAGRVGKGIYLADLNGKSAQYTSTNGDGVGIMFLMEAAMGNIHEINRDDPSLRSAPPGHHSIVARGWKHPDPSHDIVKQYDGKDVTVPQGRPIPHPKWNSNSSFAHNEYLVYKESQARMRYVLKMKFDDHWW